MYIHALKALRGQEISFSTLETLKVGQWVFLGNNGKAQYKAVYCGKINRTGEHIMCEHRGERPVQFGKLVRVHKEYVEEMNGPGAKMPNLLDHMLTFTENHRIAA